jgi:hypothetical protein
LFSHGAEAHRDYIESTLTHNGKTVDDPDALTADNCSANGAFADIMRVPIAGCAHSLQLNKAAQEF